MPAEASDDDEIVSPCVGVCQLDPLHVCVGCHRSMDEISEWPYASDPRKREILQLAQLRLAGLEKRKPFWRR